MSQNTVLLSDIKTYTGTTLIYDYHLAYSAASSGASHDELTSVTLNDASNHVAVTSFGWQGSRATLTPASPDNPKSYWRKATQHFPCP